VGMDDLERYMRDRVTDIGVCRPDVRERFLWVQMIDTRISCKNKVFTTFVSIFMCPCSTPSGKNTLDFYQ
jgi:hypothetical protein